MSSTKKASATADSSRKRKRNVAADDGDDSLKSKGAIDCHRTLASLVVDEGYCDPKYRCMVCGHKAIDHERLKDKLWRCYGVDMYSKEYRERTKMGK